MNLKTLMGLVLIFMYLDTNSVVYANTDGPSQRHSSKEDEEEESEFQIEEPTTVESEQAPFRSFIEHSERKKSYRERMQDIREKMRERWLAVKAKIQIQQRRLTRKLADIKRRISQARTSMQRLELEKEETEIRKRRNTLDAAILAGPEIMAAMEREAEEQKRRSKRQEEEETRRAAIRKKPLPETPPKTVKETYQPQSQEIYETDWQRKIRERGERSQ